ncbi:MULTISPECIES: hypothetical protein [unclassified Streptomyces]|uniref:hypothetical protein n=1 Tax=unclassified Streptomyces TaxID=2593676 RepID=UPI000A6F2258|nr:hypothetical protein [Streptomyces sp. TSRI0281]
MLAAVAACSSCSRSIRMTVAGEATGSGFGELTEGKRVSFTILRDDKGLKAREMARSA